MGDASTCGGEKEFVSVSLFAFLISATYLAKRDYLPQSKEDLGGSFCLMLFTDVLYDSVNWYQRNYPYAWVGARLVRDRQ